MSVTAAKEFVASGVHCGIRKKDRLDLSLVRSTVAATGAGMFTANRMLAAPVIVCREHLELAQPQAVVTNSGVANAATGERGLLDAHATAAETARLLGLPYPGGPAVEAAARLGRPDRFPLPRPMIGRAGSDFSFSGLKTAVRLARRTSEPFTDALHPGW